MIMLFSKIKEFIVKNYLGLFLIFICVSLVVLVSYGFPDSPSPWFDEGISLGIARSYAEKGIYNMSVGPEQYVQEKYLMITTNYPLLIPVAMIFKLFGVGLWQAKLVMVIYLFIFIFLAYLLIKKYYGFKNALLSLLLMVFFLPLYGNGKSVLGEIPGLVFILGGLLLVDKEKKYQVFLTGLLFGLGAATKPIYLLFVISLVVSEIWLSLQKRKFDFKRWAMLGAGGVLPLLIWLATIVPNIFDIQSVYHFFIYYSNPYNVGASSVIGKNIIRFFTESTPLHFLLLFVTFLIARIIKRKFTQVEIVLLSFTLLDLWFYLKTAGWYRYFFPSHILLFIFLPNSLSIIFEKINYIYIKKYGVTVVVTLLFMAQALVLFANINSKLYYNPSPRLMGDLINKMVPADVDILIVHNPALAFFVKSDRVWQYLAINPYLTSGKQWFVDGSYPDFVVVGPGSEMLLTDEKVFEHYRVVAKEGSVSLLKKITSK